MRSIEVLVAGGGASGMTAAIMAARQGAKVLLVEKKKMTGKKLLATGNGRCNFSNLLQEPECYHVKKNSLVWHSLEKFGYRETLKFFLELGIFPNDREGYLYPVTGQASSVRNALEWEMQRLGVEVKTDTQVLSIAKHTTSSQLQDGIAVETDGESYLAKKVILAVGGMAGPVHGSNGDGFRMLKPLGLQVVEPVPALTSCLVKEEFAKNWGGVRVLGSVQAFEENGRLMGRDSGELQFVEGGISGIPVFQISRYVARSLQKGRHPYLVVDLFPEWTKSQLYNEIMRRIMRNTNVTFAQALEGMLHSTLVKAMAQKGGYATDIEAREIGAEEWNRLTGVWKELRLEVNAVGDYEKAQVTCGGIALEEVGEQFELRKLNGLYLVGEVLDVDAICGGYNLQWAWTSGSIAGTDAGKSAVQSRRI